MFWALKSSNLTSKIVENVQSFSQDYLRSRPIFGGYSYDSLGKIAKEVTWEITGNLAKDDTKWAADELIKYTKERMPWSTVSADHNANFKVDWEMDEARATDALAKWLKSTAWQGNSFAASDSDSPAFRELRQKAKISGSNIINMVENEDFWNKMSRSWEGQGLLTSMSEDKNLQWLVWGNSSSFKKLKAAYNTQAEKIRKWSNIIIWDPAKDESITTAYIRDDGVYSYTTSLKDKNTTVSKVEYGAKGSKEAADIISGFKDSQSYASSIWAKLFNPNGTWDEPTWLVYNMVANKYEVRTDDDKKNRPKPEPTPPPAPAAAPSQSKPKADPGIASATTN